MNLTKPNNRNIPAPFENSLRFYFVVTDQSGRIVDRNSLFASFEKELHLTNQDLVSFFIQEDQARFKNLLEDAVKSKGTPQLGDFTVKLPDESLRSIRWEISSDDSTIRAIGYISPQLLTDDNYADITRIQENLKKSELFYRSLIADSLDGILLTDNKGTIHFASPSVTAILGYVADELINKNAFEFLHPDDKEEGVETFVDELHLKPRVKYINVRLKNKKGGYTWCIVRGHNLLGNPNVGSMVIYFTDDTLRKIAEQALHEGEKMLRTQATILNNVTDVIVTTDLERIVTSWNKVIEKLSGITSTEAIGRPHRQVLDTDYSPFTHEQVADIVFREGIWRGEASFLGQDGERKFLLHSISILHNERGEKIGLLGVGRDITERKKMEERLQNSEAFYRNLAANSLDGILMTDSRGIIRYCGPSVFKISGHELHRLLGHSIFEFVHPEDRVQALSFFHTPPEGDVITNYVNVRLWHATRGWTWSVVRGHNMLRDPHFNSIIIYFTDDTKRKEIELQLKESENKFRSLINSLSQGVVLHNEKQEVILFNPAALKILGVTEGHLREKDPYSIGWNAVFEDGTDCKPEETPGQLAFRTGKAVPPTVLGVRKQDTGERAWVLVSAVPIFDPGGKLRNVIISFADITEQKRLSRELFDQEVQRQRLLTQATIDGQEKERQEMGKELHDNINQHLTTTRLYLEVAKEKAKGEVMEMITLAHQNLSDIVNEIRQLSQSLVPPTLGDLGLVESIIELCDSLKRTHSYQVDFQFRQFNEEDLPENLKLMIFRIVQEQVSNIIRHSAATIVKIRLQTDAEEITLSISDNGKGFDPNNFKRGMGLHNISSRVSLFNGKLDIDAAPGKGCTITVTVPRPIQDAVTD